MNKYIKEGYEISKSDPMAEMKRPTLKKVKELLWEKLNKMNSDCLEPEEIGYLLRQFELYYFCKPPAKVLEKDNFKWVLAAVSEDQTRYAICFAKVKDRIAVATDGRVIHVAKVDMLDGYYTKRGELYPKYEDNAYTFPNYQRVIDDALNNNYLEEVKEYQTIPKASPRDTQAVAVRTASFERKFNMSYFETASMAGTGRISFGNDPAVFGDYEKALEGKGRFAVVMPLFHRG